MRETSITPFSMTPLEEGKPIPIRRMKLIDGKWEMVEEVPEYDPEWVDPEITETETYWQMGKDEFYYYVIKCKTCGSKFIAYDKGNEAVKNYCPGCGMKLV